MNLVRAVGTIALVPALLSAANAEVYTPGRKIDKDFEGFARPFLSAHCVDCHGKSDPAGNLALDDLGPVDEVNAGVWKTVWAQVTLKVMPPADAEQPEVVARLQFSDWIVGELSRVMRDKGGFRAHLDPDKGNFVDHELLFGPLPEGIRLRPTSSPARLWRITPQEHITRLNELINTEPKFDPDRPGLRAHGDAVPTNHGGELKLYFGVDNIIKWQGGTVAYATAVKSVPEVLATARHHGLKNYPDLYTVNSAESTQILGVAEDVIRYMAYGPLSIAEAYQITDDPASIADKMKGDLRGLPTSLVYSTKVLRPLTPVYELMKAEGVTDERLRAAADYLFEALTFRPPTKAESDEYLSIVKQSVDKLGKEEGVVLGLSSIFLDRDALFRPELGKPELGDVKSGTPAKPDEHGRVMLRDWELGLAVNHALRYLKPDEALKSAIVEGRMRTRDDVRREVERMLSDDQIRKPRVLQFFRDYFDYDLAGYVCKDGKALAETGVVNRGDSYYRAMFDATASTDRLVEIILEEDRDVLKQLLTTDKIVANKADNIFFGEQKSEKEKRAAAAEARKKNPTPKNGKPTDENHGVIAANLTGPANHARVGRRSFGDQSMRPERVLATAPEGQRLGILTHPSWLVSHSDAMDNHAIRRGKWIRERLLGGGIPDVPITVDAMLPDEPEHSLRERMRVTRESYCWTCHRKMDPLGLPFEMFNHAGLFRRTELDKPVDTTGEIIDSGDPALDGKVADALEMIRKLAESPRAEQVFVRHAFRFWMGRNETLNDGPVLQDAYRAYKEGGGSMKAMLTSLLTSDAFLYRTVDEPAKTLD
jgi:hypothetical protein